MMRALIIVNKKSGVGDKKHISQLIHQQIDPQMIHYDLVFTQYKGHATELSQQAVREGLDMVVAAGGDGSVNEVAGPLIRTNTALGIVPMGSGNGLARSLRIPLSLSKALAVINEGKVRSIDVGFVNEHLFLSNAGVGFDALVAKKFEQSRRRGLLSYILTIVRTLTVYKPAFYELSVDGRKEIKKAFFIGIANGNQLGYNFKIAPKATLDDGILDVCLIGAVPFWKLPFAAIRAYNGKLPESRFVEYTRCKELIIRMKGDSPWMQTDGDAIAIEQNQIKAFIDPLSLKVVVPC